MRKLQSLLFVLSQSYFYHYIICLTVPLNLIFTKLLETANNFVNMYSVLEIKNVATFMKIRFYCK